MKVILYAYPLLKTVGKDYADHIRNKAMLSYTGTWDTERLTEYLAEEIIQKERLEALKILVDEVLAGLSDLERELVAMRYFGKSKKIHTQAHCVTDKAMKQRKQGNEPRCVAELTEREYFRRQRKLLERLAALFFEKGITEEKYLKEFASMDFFRKIYRFVEEGRDKKRFCREYYKSSVSG